ncbi:MAG: ribosomal protein small subunit ribosomal protein [Candidatus Taylorbacteria bacterium]|nr:ribosomal protein small subunit ribosomal protein [Candidatus Taylorbacteria bacterium]
MEKKTTQKNKDTKVAETGQRKTLQGVVVSDKMKDTCVVLVERYVKDPKYQKFMNSRKRFKVHDAGNTKKIGDKVTIESCRPISRHKSFQIVS